MLGEFHQPFYAGALSCSRDGVTWLKFHAGLYARLLFRTRPRITDRITRDIRTLWHDGRSEPLSHQLYREASVQRKDAPRSALVIAVSAVEAGLKECIVRLQPEVRWLLEKTQSPPLVDMLESYWPTIQGRKQFEGKDIVFSEEAVAQLRRKVAEGVRRAA